MDGLEDILGTDVGEGSRWEQQQGDEEEREAAHYLWMPFIQVPKRRPTQVPMVPATAAQARPM